MHWAHLYWPQYCIERSGSTMPKQGASSKAAPLKVRPRPGVRMYRPIGLAALRGFEAAARRLSFTFAADELNLTQSSVSRQIASLERQIGAALFVRKTRALSLTAAGQRLRQSVTQALAGIDRTVAEIRGVEGPPRVDVTTYASFASLWLVPRLARFQRAHPDIEIRIDAADRVLDLTAERVDIALRRCLISQAPVGARLLVAEDALPALSPELRTRLGGARPRLRDIARLPLIEMDDGETTTISWSRWFQHFGFDTPPKSDAGWIYFTFIDQSMQAAMRGQGVVLARTPFIDDQIAAGTLIAPFSDQRLSTGYGMYLIESESARGRRAVVAFRDWVLEEFAQGPRKQA
jgi:LysR family glycine cleavage system transcriptional activator